MPLLPTIRYRSSFIFSNRADTVGDILSPPHHSHMVDLTERARGKLYVVPASIVTTLGMRGLCGLFFHRTHKDNKTSEISDYTNPTLVECQSIQYHVYKAYL